MAEDKKTAKKEDAKVTAPNVPAEQQSSEGGVVAVDPEKTSASESEVLTAWGNFVSSVDELALETFENKDGGKTTRLFNKNTNSTVAEAHGDDALITLYRNAGNAVVEPGKAPADSEAAPAHAMPGTGVKPNPDMLHVDLSDRDSEAAKNPGTAVAKAREEKGLTPY
jgi:hypothetical protein